MKKNIFKKVITLTYLTIFLFGLFVPFSQSFAQENLTTTATITASPGTVTSNEYSTITVRKYGTESETIKFSSDPKVEGFDPKVKGSTETVSCTTNKDFTGNMWSCPVSFRSSAKGTYTIKASFTKTTDGTNYKTYYSPVARVEVCGQSEIIQNGFCVAAPTPPTCTGTDVLNTAKDACVSAPVNLPGGNNSTPTTVNTDTTYTPLAGLPGLPSDKPYQTDPGCKYDDKGNKIGECTNPCPFGNYLNIIIKLIIGIAAVLAMVMIVAGGIEYMTSELISGKEAGKETITHAVLGLLLALGAFLILNTINPKLLSACLDNLPQATISLGGESNQPFVSIASTPTGKAALKNNFGISCDGVGGKSAVESIGKQFINKTKYSKEKRNSYDSSTIYVDCSSFAAQVYVCAGLPKPGNISTDIFSGGNTKQVDGTTFDFSTLHSGDLIGWKPGENKETDGHVMIYLGNGKMLDTQHTNKATDVRELTDALKKRIKYVRWP